MYLGRIVAIGKNQDGKILTMYRVSSRSYPNRRTKKSDSSIEIIPRSGHEIENLRNPYVSYKALRITDRYAVAGNGSHTDPIMERLGSGMHRIDAMGLVLLSMGYEKDNFQTPRIASVIDWKESTGTLGIIRHDALFVKDFDLKNGWIYYIATYNHDYPDEKFNDKPFQVNDVNQACDYILGKGVFADFELPVSAACAIETDKGFVIGCKDIM